MDKFYRQSKIGRALQNSLTNLIKNGSLSMKQAHSILQRFDKTIPKIFDEGVRATIQFRGKVKFYNNVEGMWKFTTSKFQMSYNNEIYRAGEVRIVACDEEIKIDKIIPKEVKKRGRKKGSTNRKRLNY